MRLEWNPGDLAFRDEVRAFLAAELTPELREAGERMTSVYAPTEVSLEWQRRLHARGWAAPAWPAAHGGCDWTPAQHAIFARELAEAGAPPLSPMGIGMCGPVLIAYGTPAQKARLLPRILTGEDLWCQGYSEPGAGSDLASLQMKAVRDGDHFVCTGQKLWTTHAHEANRMFCLVRTSQEAKPQLGITFVLIDMHAPGVSVRPIISLSGEHIQNVVTFDAVRVPIADVVGEIGKGWTVAKYLMEFERGGSAYAPGLRTRLKRLRAHLKASELDGARGAGLRRELAAITVETDALDALELRGIATLSSGRSPGAMASVLKVLGTELSQRLTGVELEAAAPYACAWQPHRTAPGGATPGFTAPNDGHGVGSRYEAAAALRYFNDRAGSIYAGTNEIQRNILYRWIA